jgi:aminoglycoside phosphotransferase (APT) family kinase protein
VHAARLLNLPATRVDRWARAVQPLFDLPDVTVHGDIHEGQLLVDDTGTLTGVIDWETAGTCHPLKDFDFGEWGFWLFAEFEPAFAQLRQAAWTAYASARSLAIDWLAPHLFFTVLDIATSAPGTAWQQRRRDNGLALLLAADAALA